MSGETLSLPQTYMTFRLGQRYFGFEAKLLWEASAHVTFTEVPRQIPHLMGITQLHGKIIPVLDLAGILGVPSGEASSRDRALGVPGPRDQVPSGEATRRDRALGVSGQEAPDFQDGFITVNLSGQSEPMAGFPVDEVVGFTKVPVFDLRLPAQGPGDGSLPYLAGWVGEGTDLPLLDMERLIVDQGLGSPGRERLNDHETIGETHV